MKRFNLIDEKWIPVRFPDGTRDELGIRDTLLGAGKIEAVEDPSPLVVAALHRFLLAVLYRALEGPTDIDEAKKLFRDGLPGKKITAYLEKWRGRFWLFHETYPFAQIPGFVPKTPKKWKTWPVLAAEHNADNAKVLFDHVDVKEAGVIPLAKAARWLIACQTFALAGGNSDFQYRKNAPSPSTVMVLPIGKNLCDTLIFLLAPENREVLKADFPVWERMPESLAQLQKGIKRPITGFADLYSWRTRSVKFKLQGDGKTIGELAFASGIGCSSNGDFDPMVACRIDDKKGRLPIQFRDRGFWRDFDSLLPDESRLAPRVIEHATALARKDMKRFPRSVVVLGQANNEAKIEFWRMERYILPEALAGKKHIRSEIRQLLKEAEKSADSLEKSLRTFANLVLARGGRELAKDSWKNRKWIPGDESRFIGKTTKEGTPLMLSNYWSALESGFHEILGEYRLGRDSEDIRCQWLKSVRDALNTAWEQHSASVSMGDAWAIRALVKAEWRVMRKLKELKDEISKLKSGEEDA